MPSIIINNEELIPEGFRGNFRLLVEKIEGLVSVDICKVLSGGFSRSVPLLVYANYKYTSSYQVFKIGKNDLVNDEAQSWKNFIKNGPYDHCNVVHLKEPHIPGSPHSLIVYDFAGQPGKEPITFEDLYKSRKNPEDIKGSQEYFLFPIRPPIAEKPPPPIQKDILKEYKEYIKQRREEERRSEFPKGARFIEPPIKLRVKRTSVEPIPLSGTKTDVPG